MAERRLLQISTKFGTIKFDLDHLEWSKIKLMFFDMKYVKNGKNYDVEL